MCWIRVTNSDQLRAMYEFLEPGFTNELFKTRTGPVCLLKHAVRAHLYLNHFKTSKEITWLEHVTFGGKVEHSKILNSIRVHHKKIHQKDSTYIALYNKLLTYNRVNNDAKKEKFILKLKQLTMPEAIRLLDQYFNPNVHYKRKESF